MNPNFRPIDEEDGIRPDLENGGKRDWNAPTMKPIGDRTVDLQQPGGEVKIYRDTIDREALKRRILKEQVKGQYIRVIDLLSMIDEAQ